jgi:hypothetical protein
VTPVKIRVRQVTTGSTTLQAQKLLLDRVKNLKKPTTVHGF